MLSRKAPLKRSPMRRTPRKATPAPEKQHLAHVAAMPCMVCGGTANVHHVISDGYQRLTRNHRRVIPLCREHHQDGPLAVHVIGSRLFNAKFGDQLELADRLWSESPANPERIEQ